MDTSITLPPKTVFAGKESSQPESPLPIPGSCRQTSLSSRRDQTTHASAAAGGVRMSFADDFLAEHEPRMWAHAEGSGDGLRPRLYFLGRGEHALEVAVAEAGIRPKADAVRALWHGRQKRRPSPVLLVIGYPQHGRERVTVCGPVGENPPVVPDLDVSQVERLCATALAEPTRHAAIRFLVGMLPEVGSDLPGLRNAGLLATQELTHGVPTRSDWEKACQSGRTLLGLTGQRLVERLGFTVEALSTSGSVLRVHGAKRAVAVFLDESEAFEDPATRFGTSPVSHALALADREGLPWVVMTRGRQIRLYAARADTGVGRKGRAATFVELNLALLPDEKAGYLSLLFSGDALVRDGSLDNILERSADFAAALGSRLRDRVYFEAVPEISRAIASRLPQGQISEADLSHAYEQTLMVLFRLLFVAYGEDKDLLPYRTNSRYNDHSLKRIARRLTEWRHTSEPFDPRATDLWDDVRALWDAVHDGNIGWGVPAYDGGLFSSDPQVNRAGADLAQLKLADSEFGPALTALLVDEGPDNVVGPVDFRSLSVREFGTLYEGLLESRLSIAPTDLVVDENKSYVPAQPSQRATVLAGAVYFHDRSGSRKATGSYFTKPFAVEHLLDHALEPALHDHVARLAGLIDAGDQASAAEAFFDFRCADLAMGSGHFLVAAVDRIEAGLASFLALNPIPQVLVELEELRAAAMTALGDLSAGVEIETTSLLRRQVARRCIYGVDRNNMAVELARLAIWIHTFVPGLPLSFLSHGIVEGDSLTGIGTLEEALDVLDPEDAPGQVSLHRQQIETFLARAGTALRRLAVAVEKTTRDVEESRAAQTEASMAVEPVRELFDLLIAARLGRTSVPIDVDEESIVRHSGNKIAAELATVFKSLHFPVAFPEVFLRERPGFDCLLGNPPWEEVTVEELGFWAVRFPGLKAVPAGEQKTEISRLKTARTDLLEEYEISVEEAAQLRRLLLAGPYPGMGIGDPDLYKAFCWRFWNLARLGGAIGIVLPRSAYSAVGSAAWREAILDKGRFDLVTMLLNKGHWVFDDVHEQYVVALSSLRRGADFSGGLRLNGPFASFSSYESSESVEPLEFTVDEFRSWSEDASFPLLPSPGSAEVFIKLRSHERLDATSGADWRVRAATEFHATNDKRYFTLDQADVTSGMWPVYKGASFNIWEPDTGIYYAWADPNQVISALQERRLRQQRNSRSPFSEFNRAWVANGDTLPCLHPRIVFRDITNRLNARTVIVTLIPGSVVLTNKAPYLLFPSGDARDEAFLLGLLSSIIVDWYARRTVERSLNFHLFNALPIVRAGRDSSLRRRVEELAGRLAAVDRRYADWADTVGVPVGSPTDEVKADLIAELDAAVALLYGLDAKDVRHIYETFHVGWRYEARLTAVLRYLEELSS